MEIGIGIEWLYGEFFDVIGIGVGIYCDGVVYSDFGLYLCVVYYC